MRQRGYLREFDSQKGTGFICRDGSWIFLSAADVISGELELNGIVEYDEVPARVPIHGNEQFQSRGLVARNVRVIEQAK